MLQTLGMENPLGALLRSAREAKGLTQGEVGAQAGITYSAVGQYESGSIKKPRPDRVKAIAEFLEIDPDLLSKRMMESYGFAMPAGGSVEPAADATTSAKTPRRPAKKAPELELVPNAPAFQGLGGARNVPELGIAVGGEDGDFTLNGVVIDYLPRPVALANREVFVVRVKNDSMEPRFTEGHILYVEQHRQPGPGDDAVIELYPDEEGGAGRAFIKQLVSKNSETVVALQFNPRKEIPYPRKQVKALYRVVPNNELLGM